MLISFINTKQRDTEHLDVNEIHSLESRLSTTLLIKVRIV